MKRIRRRESYISKPPILNSFRSKLTSSDIKGLFEFYGLFEHRDFSTPEAFYSALVHISMTSNPKSWNQ